MLLSRCSDVRSYDGSSFDMKTLLDGASSEGGAQFYLGSLHSNWSSLKII